MVVTRRQFLLLTGAATSAALVTAAAYVGRPFLSRRAYPKLDKTYPLGSLQDSEMRTVLALGEVLVPAKHAPPEQFFREYINRVTQTQPGYLREYQCTVKLLDATSRSFSKGKPFRDLTTRERDKVLEALLWRYDKNDLTIIRKVEKYATSRDATALRKYIVTPMIDYYYRSPYGWAVVGYTSFPGVPPADPMVYTRRPDEEGTAG